MRERREKEKETTMRVEKQRMWRYKHEKTEDRLKGTLYRLDIFTNHVPENYELVEVEIRPVPPEPRVEEFVAFYPFRTGGSSEPVLRDVYESRKVAESTCPGYEVRPVKVRIEEVRVEEIIDDE